MTELTLAVTQMSCSWNRQENLETAEHQLRNAAAGGANCVLLPELFETPYFCREQNPDHFELARPFEGNETIAHFASLAGKMGVVIPLSFFEKSETQYFNSVAMIDATGEVMGLYRKIHLHDGSGYHEKFYFTPGNTGFKVWETAVGRIGVGVCWDQWFPETARAMALMGADVLLYPSAIGIETNDPKSDSKAHWQRTMQGHGAANMTVVAASNRVGVENVGTGMAFYGGSFIADETGAKLEELDDQRGVTLATFDLTAIRRRRAAWGLFKDRRPDQYQGLTAHG